MDTDNTNHQQRKFRTRKDGRLHGSIKCAVCQRGHDAPDYVRVDPYTAKPVHDRCLDTLRTLSGDFFRIEVSP